MSIPCFNSSTKDWRSRDQHAALSAEEQGTGDLSHTQDTIGNPDSQYFTTPSRHQSSVPRQAESPASTHSVNQPLNNEPALDVTSILSCAVDKVQQLRKKRRFGVRALTLEPITISPERAKQWIYRELPLPKVTIFLY